MPLNTSVQGGIVLLADKKLPVWSEMDYHKTLPLKGTLSQGFSPQLFLN